MLEKGSWIELNEAPLIQFKSIVKLSDEEFMIAPYGNKLFNRHFYKYHTTDNEWSFLFEDSNEQASVAYNFMNNELFVCKDAIICKIENINSESLQKMIIFRQQKKIENEAGNIWCFMINDELHVIGDKHYIWNDKTKKLMSLKTQFMFSMGNVSRQFLCDNILYIPSRDKLLGFRGNCIYMTEKLYEATKISWTLIDTVHGMPNDWKGKCNGMVLTNDERYVVLFDGNKESKSIYLLDLNVLKWKKSKIEMPFSGSSCAQLMGKQNNGMLVNGYIRMVILDGVSDMYVPTDIANLLVIWYGCDEIHLFEYKTGHHWEIKFDEIL
eukprot:160339_1